MYKFLSILLLPLLALSQPYLWPTNASRYMSSGFCEYRPGHFHAALDIKTWNREGYPCYAIDDGKILKIRISPFGYGKALYIRLKDGRITVYGHLQRFSKNIEEKIHALQMAQKKYSVIWQPKNFSVKKGQLVAYSGQTGIGVPHLHFEVRDPQGRPLNPLQFYKNVIQDHIAPKLLELLVIPQDENSRINGSFLPQAFTLTPMHNNVYIVKKPMVAQGRVGLALRGFDRADGVYNKFNFYRLTLRLEDKKIFQLQYDRFDFTQTHQVDISIYYPFKAHTGRIFTKLYLESYNTLPFYQRNLNNGRIEMQGTPLHFTIDAADFFGNTSHVTGVLQAQTFIKTAVLFVKRQGNFAYLKLKLPLNLQTVQFFESAAKGKNHPIDYFEILNREADGDLQTLLVKLRLRSVEANKLRCVFSTTGRRNGQLLMSLSTDSGPRPRYQILNCGKFIDLIGADLKPGSRVEISTEKRKITPAVQNRAFNYVLPARFFIQDTLHLKTYFADSLLTDSSVIFNTLYPGQAQTFTFDSQHLQLSSTPNSLYDTLLFTLRKTDPPDSFPAFSPLYELSPSDQVFKGGPSLSLAYDSLYAWPRKLGLYKISKKGHPCFWGSQKDSIHHLISARLSSFGKFVLLADTVAPQVEMISPLRSREMTRVNKIVFSARDGLSGIGNEKNLSITLDGQFVLPEWDPEQKRITGRFMKKLLPGRHRIGIVVKDRAGNETRKILKISVKE